MSGSRTKRVKRRVNCELVFDGERQRGIVIDVSETGIFVQTKAELRPNRVLEVWFPSAHGMDPFGVRARVARVRRVPPELMRIVAGGLGLEVLETPPQFLKLLAGERGAARANGARAKQPQEPKELPCFRVRIKQVGGPRSRTVTVQAEDPAAAGPAALRQAGNGWEVRGVDPA